MLVDSLVQCVQIYDNNSAVEVFQSMHTLGYKSSRHTALRLSIMLLCLLIS